MFREVIACLTMVMLIAIAVMTFRLGIDWMEIGTGLNPIISFPISTIAAFGAVAIMIGGMHSRLAKK